MHASASMIRHLHNHLLMTPTPALLKASAQAPMERREGGGREGDLNGRRGLQSSGNDRRHPQAPVKRGERGEKGFDGSGSRCLQVVDVRR